MIFAILLLMQTSSSAAAEHEYCEPLAKINLKSSGCVDNEVTYAEAGVVCLNRFSTEIDLLGSELASSLFGARRSVAATKNQEKYFNDSEGNFEQSNFRISLLILNGRRALAQVKDYQTNLSVPEDYEVARDMGFTPESFLHSIPCYSENKKVLKDVYREFEEKISDLEMARAKMISMKNVVSGSKLKVSTRNEILMAPIRAISTHSGVKQKKLITTQNASDITGTNRKASRIP